jgi:SAM-dependent methyltransferase
MDTVLRQRARDILKRSGLSRQLPEHGLLLDVGAGSGHLSEAVIRRMPGRTCVATDLDHVPPPRLAARMRHRDFHALRADGQRLPFADATFDAAWIGFVLHHMAPDQQDRVLDEVARVVRPGGALLLLEDTPATPSEYRTTLAADRRLNMESRAAPHHYRSPAAWRAALPARGWRVLTEEAFTRLLPPATLRPVPHRLFVCRQDGRQQGAAPPSSAPCPRAGA